MIATLAAKHRSWTRAERQHYAGQEIQLTEEIDHSGRRLCLVLSGELTGLQRWFEDSKTVIRGEENFSESAGE